MGLEDVVFVALLQEPWLKAGAKRWWLHKA